jgi:hypothetical protein
MHSQMCRQHTHPRLSSFPQPGSKTVSQVGRSCHRSSSFASLSILYVVFPHLFCINLIPVQVIYALLPILIPMGISLMVINLTLATRSSRARIRLLERDASNKEKLIHILAELENDVENAVVDLIDDPNPAPSRNALGNKMKPSSEQPILTPLQRKIAASLNKLPFKKELTYIENVRNAHAIIVCRDVKRFEVHKQGAGVLRHWAASFVL